MILGQNPLTFMIPIYGTAVLYDEVFIIASKIAGHILEVSNQN